MRPIAVLARGRKHSLTFGGTGGSWELPPFWTSGAARDAEEIDVNFAGYVSGAYKTNGVVFACILARLLVFSEARFQFQNVLKGRPSDLFGDPSLAILERPWPNGTTGELLAHMEQDTSLAGNFYATVVKDEHGRRIRRLRPDWVTIITGSESGSPSALDARPVGYIYEPKTGVNRPDPVILTPDKIVHWSPLPDPDAQWRGMSWITPIVRDVKSHSAATAHKLKYFEQGATGGIVVKYDASTSQAAVERFAELWKETHHGPDNIYKTYHLGGGADVDTLGADLQQLDFKVTQGQSETLIAAAAGVGAVIAQLSEGLQGSSLNSGNFNAAKRRFADGPQPLSAKVLTPGGWTTMGEIAVGESVVGSDGRSHRVTGVFDQPSQAIYRVTFLDGAIVECSLGHTWTVGNEGMRSRGTTRSVTLAELLDIGLRTPNGVPRWGVQLVDPVEFDGDGRGLPVDPYVLGLLLGDGCFTNTGGVTLATSSADADEVASLVTPLLPVGVTVTRHRPSGGVESLGLVGTALRSHCRRGHEYTSDNTYVAPQQKYRQCRTCARGSKRRREGSGLDHAGYGDGSPPANCPANAILTSALASLGLRGVGTPDKFIPGAYQTASIKDRVNLLQGLIDSDGCVTQEGDVRFTSSAPALVEGVVALVRSLGGVATIRHFTGRTIIDVGISRLPAWIVPARLSRKADRYRIPRVGRFRSIIGVEKVRQAPTRCIAVDSDDHLYVTDGFVLTHNTIRPLWRSASAALESICPPPHPAARLWYDARDVPFLKDDAKDEAEIQSQQASTINSLVGAGYDADTVVKAVTSGDLRQLIGAHSGLFSVQLQPAGAGQAPKRLAVIRDELGRPTGLEETHANGTG